MKKLLASLLLILVCSTAKAERTKSLWYDIYGGSSGTGTAIGSKLNYSKDENLVSFGTINHDVCMLFCFEQPNGTVEFFATAGKLYRWRSHVMSAQVGLSKVNDYNRSQEWFGIPLRLDFTLGKYVGLLAGIHALVGEEHQFVSFHFGVSFGKWH